MLAPKLSPRSAPEGAVDEKDWLRLKSFNFWKSCWIFSRDVPRALVEGGMATLRSKEGRRMLPSMLEKRYQAVLRQTLKVIVQ